MDYKEDLDKSGAPAAKTHKIRITLTSRNVKPLEKCRWIEVERTCRGAELTVSVQSVVTWSTEPRTGT